MNNYITTDWLNLRSEPLVKQGNVLGIMPPDTVIEEIENKNGWLKLKWNTGKIFLEGFASQKYLLPTDKTPANIIEQVPSVPEAHLTTNKRIIRGSIEGRAYPLNELGLVKNKLAEINEPAERKKFIHNVIGYLDVEHSARYSPTTKNTFCNIYATDVAYCLGLYIPRVWWNSQAINKILNGEKVEPLYDRTVTELNANSLANWFENYGAAFKWKQVVNIAILQEEVNKGLLGIIVAQRIDLNRSGHIVSVVPEMPGLSAQRDSVTVLSPLQSQAGVTNKKYFTGNNWWQKPGKFRKFGLWIREI